LQPIPFDVGKIGIAGRRKKRRQIGPANVLVRHEDLKLLKRYCQNTPWP